MAEAENAAHEPSIQTDPLDRLSRLIGLTLYHVAVVCSPQGVRSISVATSPEGRDRELAEYVRRAASRQLAPWTRDRVLALLDGGEPRAAVDAYFEAVGREWDDEWLHLEVVERAV